MVLVFVPKETELGETRVAAVPETVKPLVASGVQVEIESSAGLCAGFTDAQYVAVGAKIVTDSLASFGRADVVLKIRAPHEAGQELEGLKSGVILISSLQPMLRLDLVRALAERKVTSFALDLVPRITRAQKMDILSSQATSAGYQAVLIAAMLLPRFFPMMMTAAGTITPARVFVLGAGVAGLQAIASARRLGGIVEANDVRPMVKEQVESLGAKFVDTGAPPEAQGQGGYAKETGDEYRRKQQEILTAHIAQADVVITTASIPGKRAPLIVSDAMLQGMKQGSIVVDLAAENGGNVEGIVKGERIVRHGVTLVGDVNLPGQKPYDSSRMFSRNVLGFLELFLKKGQLATDFQDEILVAAMVTHLGEIRHKGAADAVSAKGAS